jgi:hypothetical protein
MLARPLSTAPAPDDVRPPGPAEPVPGTVPTLRQILARFRQQGTAPGRLAAAVPVAQPAAAPQLKSLRNLFLDSTGDPALDPVAREDAWTQAPPPRRR